MGPAHKQDNGDAGHLWTGLGPSLRSPIGDASDSCYEDRNRSHDRAWQGSATAGWAAVSWPMGIRHQRRTTLGREGRIAPISQHGVCARQAQAITLVRIGHVQGPHLKRINRWPNSVGHVLAFPLASSSCPCLYETTGTSSKACPSDRDPVLIGFGHAVVASTRDERPAS